MPVMDGMTLLARVRARGIDTPFVFLSALGDKANLKSAMKLGANEFIDKPFTTSALREVVTNALQLGVRMREIDDFFEQCAADPAPSPVDIERVQEARKAVQALRAKGFGDKTKPT
jgi:FixJ family two-component response regulator